MLKLVDIVKNYGNEDNLVRALKGINVQFRKSEFVAILGQSGCGKTTMLNIIGGLDRYTQGDLIIDGVSTKEYKDVDWDAYRNFRIGFIFQSYNLISHISILENVEMALTLSGVGKEERRRRATKALQDVGLGDKLNKKPNELSGGQMQRVSIARALINNPEIILADEPTGALDSATSVQIMDILKEVSKDKLVVMVTHNPELAKQYATRTIKLNDGEIVSDDNPYFAEEPTSQKLVVEDEKERKKQNKKDIKNKKKRFNKTSMNFFTALKLSFNNLKTKKGRTIITAIAGSIGIIGVALVLAVSNGMNNYIADIQQNVLASYPISIANESMDSNKLLALMMTPGGTTNAKPSFPDGNIIYPYDPSLNYKDLIKKNDISQEYVDYIKQLENNSAVDSIRYGYGIDINVISKVNTAYLGYKNKYDKVAHKLSYTEMITSMASNMMPGAKKNPDIGWQELPGNQKFILEGYDIIGGQYPTKANEVALVVDKSNQLNKSVLAAMGIKYNNEVTFEDIYKVNLKVATNNAFYRYDEEKGLFVQNNIQSLYENSPEGVFDLKIVGVLRQRVDNQMPILSSGIAYTSELTQYMMKDSMDSDIVKAQQNSPEKDIITGYSLTEAELHSHLALLGGRNIPTVINIYPKDFAGKNQIISYLDEWNESDIYYNDMSKFATDMMSQTIDIISIALICFGAVSLVVSTVMIGVITYVSVVERTKEIGILRSLGARKKDIVNVFNAETSIIGLVAGLIGVIITYLVSIPINIVIYKKIQISTLCLLSPLHAILLVLVSIALTLIAGLIPAYIASKRDVVIALRSE